MKLHSKLPQAEPSAGAGPQAEGGRRPARRGARRPGARLTAVLALALGFRLAAASAGGEAPALSARIGAASAGPQASAEQQEGSGAPRGAHMPCRVTGGESVLILEIEESRANGTEQRTSPAELPIAGPADELELRIESQTHRYFEIRDKQLRLVRPLDRDPQASQRQPISSVYLQVSCQAKGAGRKVIIPVLVKVLDLNDNAPGFAQAAYTAHVDELAPVGQVIFDQLGALDLDSAENALLEYSLAPAPPLPAAESAPSSPSSPVQRGPAAPEAAGDIDDEPDDDESSSAANASDLAGRRAARRRRDASGAGSPPWTNLMTELLAEPGARREPATPDDPHEFFSLELVQGRPVVRLRKQLDYESRRLHRFRLVATDRARRPQDRLSGSTELLVRVLDGDDQPPVFLLEQAGCSTAAGAPPTTTTTALPEGAQRRLDKRSSRPGAAEPKLPKDFKVTDEAFEFGDGPAPRGAEPASSSGPPAVGYNCLPALGQPTGNGTGVSGGQAEYFATVLSGQSDYLLRVGPQAVKARDRDELNAPVRYSFVNGTPPQYANHFQINPLDGTVKQVAPLERQQVPLVQLWLRAQEQAGNRLWSLARLTIEVAPNERQPPVLSAASSPAGFVPENSPVGTTVLTRSGEPMRLEVSPASSAGKLPVPPAGGLFEFHSTSDAFRVTRDGLVQVNQWPLDRDASGVEPGALHRFQVTARQLGVAGSQSVSDPVALTVSLLDVDDNPPQFVNSSLRPLELTAGGAPGQARPLVVLRASDPDEPENARAHFGLVHVSNGARERYRLQPDSGELEALGRFQAGERHSLTVQVSDALARASQAILEVAWLPGPNTGTPQLVQPDEQPVGRLGYALQVSEGLVPGTPILQLRARDPEQDPALSFSIVAGNANQDFAVDARSGLVSLARPLDREEVSAYRLAVAVADSGGLQSQRPLEVQVLDVNDQNPEFGQRNYSFAVPETAPAGHLLGFVQATDADSGENGRLSYRLEHLSAAAAAAAAGGQQLFAINETSGAIRLVGVLDFESARAHTLLVGVTDHGTPPRSSTASVQVLVLDQPDERPYFERRSAQVSLCENATHPAPILQLRAQDPDTDSQVTYVLRSGNASLFAVAPATGQLSLVGALDYEQQREHLLVVGTLENPETLADDGSAAEEPAAVKRWPEVRVQVSVLDANDHAPHFLAGSVPASVRVRDSASPGHQVAQLEARDLDGSAANSELRYELLAARDADELRAEPACPARLFLVDPRSGAVSVRASLSGAASDSGAAPLSECRLRVRASDSGEPSLSASAELTVYIDHVAELAPASAPGFLDSLYTLELDEDAPAGQLIKVLGVANKPRLEAQRRALSCELVSSGAAGEPRGHFRAELNAAGDCELRTGAAPLDYEARPRHQLSVRLNTAAGGHSTANQRSLAQVSVQLLDVNDNRPQFPQVARYAHLIGPNRYLAAVARSAASDTQLIQLRATDLDSAARGNGQVTYELQELAAPEAPTAAAAAAAVPFAESARFKVEPVDGIVRTARPVEDVAQSRLPLRLRLVARDSPEPPGRSLESSAEIFVNLVDDQHRMALVLRDTPTGRALDLKEELLAVLQERSGLLAGLERAESLKLLRNGTVEPDVTGTDFWFYLVEPATFLAVGNEEPLVKAGLLEERARQSVQDILAQRLGLNKTRIRLPYQVLSSKFLGSQAAAQPGSNGLADDLNGLVWFALGLAATALLVILCQCTTWSSASSSDLRHGPGKRMFADKHLVQPPFYQAPPFGPKCQPPLDASLGHLGGMLHQQPSTYPTLLSNHQQTLALPKKQPLPANPQEPAMYQHINKQQQQQQCNNTLSKEYETQMLKMSVLFDDCNSVDINAANRMILK